MSTVNIGDLPSGTSRNPEGIDASCRIGNVTFDIRETIGRRTSQEDQLFTTPTPLNNKEQARNLLENAYKAVDEQTRNNESGSCSTTAIVTQDNYITIAHLGDCPAVLFVQHVDGTMSAHSLINPHKPDDPEEKARIEQHGGTVALDSNGHARIHGDGLNLSRAFGDKSYGAMVSKTPDITQIKLAEYVKPGEKAYLCVSCDGLYERNVDERDFAEILRQAESTNYNGNVASLMKNLALKRGSTDNITVILAALPDQLTHSVAMGVCDGHGGRKTAIEASSGLQQFAALGEVPALPQPSAPGARALMPGATDRTIEGQWRPQDDGSYTLSSKDMDPGLTNPLRIRKIYAISTQLGEHNIPNNVATADGIHTITVAAAHAGKLAGLIAGSQNMGPSR